MDERNAATRTALLDLRFCNVVLDGTKADGRIELYFDGASYLQRHYLGGAVLVEIEQDDVLQRYTIDPDWNPTRASTSDAKGTIERAFWGLLPSLTPEHADLVDDASESTTSKEHLKIAQTGTVFWVDGRTGDVVRTERSDAVSDFEEFVARDGLRFPTRISTRTVSTGGDRDPGSGARRTQRVGRPGAVRGAESVAGEERFASGAERRWTHRYGSIPALR